MMSMSLPGTGWDLQRARSTGASPVGGASNTGGGFERKEFASTEEVQCAKYNTACCLVGFLDCLVSAVVG